MRHNKQSIQNLIPVLLTLLLLSGCASYAVVENTPIDSGMELQEYSLKSFISLNREEDDISIFLAFSGGGSRAAAFAYGVLEALNEREIRLNNGMKRMSDAVDIISAVSGGSFTAAYYGLYGDSLFSDFKKDFLYRDVEKKLLGGLYNPSGLFDGRTRTELAVEYFDEILFRGATFSDLLSKQSPFIIINATDLGGGVRISFTQEYFNLLCSDLSLFPVSRAVTASAAVPVLFSPLVIRNYPGCMTGKPDWLENAQQQFSNDSELSLVTAGLETYLDKQSRKYIHLVDGGVTDNLGLRSLYEIMQLSGGPKQLLDSINRSPPRRVVIIVVNASTQIFPQMDSSPLEPSLEETVNALTDAQLHRYNAATIDLIKQRQKQWAKELSSRQTTVIPYFIQLRFKDLDTVEDYELINQIPTGLRLDEAQADKLIEAGKQLLNSNAEFQRLLKDIEAESGTL